MELNTQIWGNSTERTAAIGYDSEIPNFPAPYQRKCGKYQTIKEYCDHDLLTVGTPIDESIGYAVCDRLALGDRAFLYYDYESGSINDKFGVKVIGEFYNTCGYAMAVSKGENNGTPYRYNYTDAFAAKLAAGVTISGNNQYLWSPDGDSSVNMAFGVAPLVDWGIRNIFYVLELRMFNPVSGVSYITDYYDAFINPNTAPERVNDVVISAQLSPYYLSSYLDYHAVYTYMPYTSYDIYQYGTFAIPLTPAMINGREIYTYYENGSTSSYRGLMLFGLCSTWDTNYTTIDDTKYAYKNAYLKGRTYLVNNPNNAEANLTPTFYGWHFAKENGLNSELNCVNCADENGTAEYQIYTCLPNNEIVKEWLIKSAAAYGVFYSLRNYSGIAEDDNKWTNDYMYLGLLDENAVGHGEYTHGADNANNPAYNWSNSDSGYIPPSPTIDPNTYSDTTIFNDVNYQNTMTKRYLLNSADVGRLAAELWSAQADKPAGIDFTDYVLDEYLTNNPIDTIVSLKYFPCKFPDQNVAVVYLGKYQTNIAAAALSTSVKVIDFDPIMVYPHYGDYRDFEPYTTLQIYIPFCVVIGIPTAEAMGRYVAVKLCIDVSTGACAGYVIVSQSGTGGICVATATGTAAIDIPVSGLQSANLAQAVFNATANWTQTQVSTGRVTGGIFAQSDSVLGTIARGFASSGISAGSIVGGLRSPGAALGAATGLIDKLDPLKAMQSGMTGDISAAKAEYELSHIQLPIRMIGSTAPALSSVLESSVRLIIYRPITDETALSQYADTVGYACLKSGVVSDFTGYTTGTIDVSGINASSEEQQLIARAFATGVYL